MQHLLADTNGREDDKDPALNEDGRQSLLVAHILCAIESHHVVGEVCIQAHACHMKSTSITFSSTYQTQMPYTSVHAITKIPPQMQQCMPADACMSKQGAHKRMGASY